MTELERIIAEMRDASRAQRKISQREFSCGLHDWADRLAALAKAAPVYFDSSKLTDEDRRALMAPGEYTPIGHAPAKAREVTDADVERAVEAYENMAGRYTASSSGIRAALATFAEGD